MISAMAKKGKQAEGIVLDLSRSSVSLDSLGNILLRIRNAGATRIDDVIIVGR